jgi:hypothetical protein
MVLVVFAYYLRAEVFMGFEIRFSDKEVTAWGGLTVMKEMLDHLDFAGALKRAQLPQPSSNRGYQPEQLMLQFIVSFWCGANRFAHSEITRYDVTLGKLFGFAKMANHQAITRLFQRFTQSDNDRVFNALYSWIFAQISLVRLTLDLDSTVMTRYGVQQGAAIGFNPAKRGRASHHPLMAFVSETRMMANFWLRPGNTGSANNVLAFFDSTLAHLGNKVVGLVRADSGFADANFMQRLEADNTDYIITLKLNQPLQRALTREQTWVNLAKGIDLISIMYQAPSWKQPRRVVGIRQHISIKPDAKGKTLSLFADDPIIRNYRYSALVTTLQVSALEVWRTYRGRADCENRIKELKYDFGADSFCLRDFWATEAALNTVMIGYNLMSLFRQAAADQGVHKDRDGDGSGAPEHPAQSAKNDADGNAILMQMPLPAEAEKVRKEARKRRKQLVQSRLSTLRFKLFAKPGFLTKEGRKTVLNLAIASTHREWFEGLWNAAKSFTIPIKFKPAF